MPPLDQFLPDDAIPASSDILVVGGGIVGICLSLFLAEKGISVALCEKGVVGGEQSGRNLGWCRSAGRHPSEAPLGKVSLDLWRTMDARIDAETGFGEIGRLFICTTPADIAAQQALVVEASRFDIPVQRLPDDDARRLLPGLPRGVQAVFHAPCDARADPAKAVPAIARAAHRRGVRILSGCAVHRFETEGGRIVAAITEKGRIACGGAVLAAGAWTEVFCRSLGIAFPMVPLAASVMRTDPLESGPQFCIGAADFGLTANADGSFSLSPFGGTVSLDPSAFRYFRAFLPMLRSRFHALNFRLDRFALREWAAVIAGGADPETLYERDRSLDPPVHQGSLARTQAWASSLVPALARMPIQERWAGVIDASPDAIPTIDAAPGINGLWIAGGFTGHGFGFGPGAARLLAEMVTGEVPVVDQTPYQFSRFGPRVDRPAPTLE